ncbi:MAG: hypothetical protein ACOC9Z_07395 [Chloroflexota bacterium]
MTNYRMQTLWWTPAATGQIWDALAHLVARHQNVQVLRDGDESGAGTVLRQWWRSRVPYTLVFDLEMLRIESGRLLEGRASGDPDGACRWKLIPVNDGTEIRFEVDVRTGRWWMNLPLPLAPRVVRAGFGTIMGWGREGLQQTLGLPVFELRAAGRQGYGTLEPVTTRAEE